MPAGFSGIELSICGIARLIGIEFRLLNPRIVDIESVEATIGAELDQVAGSEPNALLASLTSVFRILACGLARFFRHDSPSPTRFCRAVNVTSPLVFRRFYSSDTECDIL